LRQSALEERFGAHGWEREPLVFAEPGDLGARMDFMKERVGLRSVSAMRLFWKATS
jgi:hypothetical protein